MADDRTGRQAVAGIFLVAAVAVSFSTATARAEEPAVPGVYDLERCRLTVTLEPEEHLLEATAELTLAATGEPGELPPLRLELLPQLTLETVTDGEREVAFLRVEEAEKRKEAPAGPDAGDEGGQADLGDPSGGEAASVEPPEPAVYHLDWAPSGGRGTLTLRYGGRLVEDVAAGEKIGEIHNFQVRAHVAPEGVYLSEEVPWYPRPAPPEGNAESDGEEPPLDLAQWEVTAAAGPGMLLVASGDRDGAALDAPRGESTTWRSPFPFPGVTLAGGPHQAHQRQAHQRQHSPVLVSVHLRPESAAFAPGLLDAVEHYLELYTPRLGPYPYREFTIAENFFSSGFALPGYTLLASAVIQMGERGLRPGYLDHELLHNWWGNGVFVSPRDGNWAEGLATYTGNYMRKVLEGDLEGARRDRRDTTHALSRLPAEEDRPLDTFGQGEDGAGRLIGYQKGAMVFAQLARRIGQEAVWRALARFFREHRGQAAGWEEIRRAAEAESGRDLTPFFDFWVRSSGLPEIGLERAIYDPAGGKLRVTLSRMVGDRLPLDVPARITGDGWDEEHSIHLEGQEVTATFPVSQPPLAVELDPGYRLLRRLPPELLMPTLGSLRPGKPLTVVTAEEDLPAYELVAQAIRKRYEEAHGDEGHGDGTHAGEAHGEPVTEIAAPALEPGDLARGHALLLGRAARTEAAQDLLGASPLRLTAAGFRVDDQTFEEPDQAVLCCLRNPADPGGVICLYLGNGEPALANAGLVTFYGNSLLVFDGGTPVLRRDFDRTERLAVEPAGGPVPSAP